MIFNKLFLLVIIALALMLGACVEDSNATNATPLINFTELFSGDHTLTGLPENRKIEVFTDQASFNAAVSVFQSLVNEYTVDFGASRVVLLSMGPRPSGGYRISADSIEDHGDYMLLKVTLAYPGENCDTTQAFTSPYQFIEVESVQDLIISEQVIAVDCGL